MTATPRQCLMPRRFPPGLAEGTRVIANARHAKAHKTTAPERQGTVTAPCGHRDFVYVLWDGLQGAQPVHRNYFDVVAS